MITRIVKLNSFFGHWRLAISWGVDGRIDPHDNWVWWCGGDDRTWIPRHPVLFSDDDPGFQSPPQNYYIIGSITYFHYHSQFRWLDQGMACDLALMTRSVGRLTWRFHFLVGGSTESTHDLERLKCHGLQVLNKPIWCLLITLPKYNIAPEKLPSQ